MSIEDQSIASNHPEYVVRVDAIKQNASISSQTSDFGLRSDIFEAVCSHKRPFFKENYQKL